MAWLLNSTLVQRFFNQESNPLKVVEVKPDRFSRPECTIRIRDDSMFLYCINQENFEIVMQRPVDEGSKMFSLFRSNDQNAAWIKFENLNKNLPVVVEVARETCQLSAIQKICDLLEANPGWNVAHIVASLDLHLTVANEKILRFVNVPDVHTGRTPIVVAIQAQNIQTIRTLMANGASLDLLDCEANSVFHHSASTTSEIITTLVENTRPACIDYRNIRGLTALHVACQADKPECVKALLLAGADCNISANTGILSTTPTNPGNVGNLLQRNPIKFEEKDMKNGGTPLHWSVSREVLESLLDEGCHIDALDFDRRTALHMMVRRKRLECMMTLLCRNADPNIGDINGNSPLHDAVMVQIKAMVQGLIVFGANVNHVTAGYERVDVTCHYDVPGNALTLLGHIKENPCQNNNGETPRHVLQTDVNAASNHILYILHTAGARRCPPGTQGCTQGCKFDESYDGTPAPSPPIALCRKAIDEMLDQSARFKLAQMESLGQKRKRCHVLSMDGGGIRGLLLIAVLLELEAACGKPIQQCFDWIAGTSTGGILALALGAGKSLRECLCLYFSMKNKAFHGSRPYPSEPLENLLKECFGPNTVMSDIVHPKLMVMGILADRKPVDLHIFRNYLPPSVLLGETEHINSSYPPPPLPHEQEVWSAARASGAAPSYFKSFGRFLDGGLMANNPTLDCLTEIHEYNLALEAKGCSELALPVTLVVSLGTGNIPVTELRVIDVFRPDKLFDAAKLCVGMSRLGTLMVDQATQSCGRVVDRARAWCSMIGVPYYRFCPPLSEDISMDEKSDEKLLNMVWECQVYMRSQAEQVAELAEILKNN